MTITKVFLILFTAPTIAHPVRSEDRPATTVPPPERTATTAGPGHSLHGEAFDEGPRTRAVLLPGMGKVDFPATTARPEAEAFINQGVAQLHSFYYFEAERSFRTAALIDPACPMAYWGMAMANVNNPKRARGFLAEARTRAAKVDLTGRERHYIEALDGFHKEGASEEARSHEYVRGSEAVIKEAPADLDARAWLALALSQSGHRDSDRAVDIVLESVLKLEPEHPGAHHYRIHLWDGRDATQALGSAADYAQSAPGIAHAWHMPGHTYTELHRHADAAYHQEAASRVDHAAMLRDRTMPFEIHNYAHNQQWLCTSLAHVGRVRDAVAVARNLVALPRDPAKNRADDPNSAQRLGRLRWVEALIRYELWDDLIAATASGALDWSEVPAERIMKAYALGLASAAKDDRAGLAAQVAALKRLGEDEARRAAEAKSKKISVSLDWDAASRLDQAEIARQVGAGLKSAAERVKQKEVTAPRAATPENAAPRSGLFGQAGEMTLEAALAELEGYQSLAGEDVGSAFVKFSKTMAMRPEARARAHLKVGNAAFATTTAKAALERADGEVAALAAHLEVMAALGHEGDTQASAARLATVATRADRDLPVFLRLATALDGWDPGGAPEVGHPGDRDTRRPIRSDLAPLGPLTWSPSPAEDFSILDTEGKPWTLADHRAGS